MAVIGVAVFRADAMPDFLMLVLVKIKDVLVAVLPSIFVFALILAALTPFQGLACNPDKPWWRNRGLFTDLCYCFILPFFAPYLRLALLMLAGAFAIWLVNPRDLEDFFMQGHGPIRALPFWAQVVLYLVVSDLLMYWIHRLFHGERMWRYHAIHHSAQDVDWTTAYRFHPVNLWLDAFLVDALMMLVGVPAVALVFFAPFNQAISAFVHANLNWTLGPFKYVFASPVFHRWHHTSPGEGGNMNFAPTFSFWDVLFGTFYMPEGKLPERYGVDDPAFPENFGAQLIYPFRAGPTRTPAVVVPGAAAKAASILLRRQ
jgi:sterol desaturase/sphingolipid hydroxylase (fatty acid hydroxylase superfamily)